MFTKKRSDGAYIEELPHFTRLLPYLMPRRSEALIFFEQDFDVTEAMRYVRRANEGAAPGSRRLTLFHVLLAATVRTLTLRPKLNRFVAGYRYYRRNAIVLNFVAKRELSDGGEEINLTLPFPPRVTLAELSAAVAERVSATRRGAGSGADDLNALLARLPRFALRLVFAFLSWADYHNGLPASFTKGMPFFSSVFLTNTGSVGIDAPFHHNFEFGTCGLFVALGRIRKEAVPLPGGGTEERERVKVTFTYDDRIADGIYCGRAIGLLRSFVEDPRLLEAEPELDPETLAELGPAAD